MTTFVKKLLGRGLWCCELITGFWLTGSCSWLMAHSQKND